MLKINDALTLSAIADELCKALYGQRITKTAGGGANAVALITRGKNLIIRTGNNAAVYLAAEDLSKSDETNFSAFLQKHIGGGFINEIAQPPYERILRIKITALNELRDENTYFLFIELMGKYGNIILTDAELVIKGSLVKSGGARPVSSGVKYTYPIGTASEEYIKKTLSDELRLPGPVWDDRKAIPKERFIAVFSDKAGGADKGAFKDIDTVNGAAELYYSLSAGKEAVSSRRRGIVSALESITKACAGQAAAAEETLRACADNASDKLYGDIIMNSLYLIKPGAASARLINYNDGAWVEIPLDPKITPQECAARYYKSAAKKQRQYAETEISKAEAEETAALAARFLPAAEAAETLDALENIAEEISGSALGGQKGFRPKKESRAAGRGKAKPDIKQIKPDMEIDGFKIYAGKNDIQNDGLTFKLGRKNDVWLHAMGTAGSHVLIQARNRPVPMPVILKAAAAAAYGSKAAKEEKAAVDYTLIQYVKKQKGGKPGQVTYSAQKTVFVKPEKI